MNGAGGENEKDSGNSSGGKDGGVISYREVVPPKFARTDSYPFRMPSSFSRSTENGPTFYNVSHLYDAAGSAVAGAAAVAARTVQPFLTAFKSPGMASLRFPFTSAQWQELEQQALICKYLMAAMPIPPELVIPFRKSLANAVPIITSHSNLGWGSFNLRFSGSSDPEPGRCRRTDGKKWRCSRDVAPDQKYCERHMHRGRPRSRKHVEVQVQNKPSTASSNQALTTSTSQISTNGGIFTKPSCGTDFKLPLQTLVPEKDSSRSLNWMEGDIADPNHQWDLYNSKHGETQQLCKSSSNDCFFLNTDLGSLERDSTQRQEQSERGFIDAWSQVRGSSDQSSVGNNKHSLSSLSLSMSHGEMGSLGVENDCEQDSPAAGVKPATQPLNWMIPVSWQQSPTLGGPLAEVLGSSTGAANSPSRKGGCIEKSWYDGDGAGLNLMSNGWREVSPRDSPRLVSSPSGVLQKTLASLSDSSSGSSHTFAAKSDIALQWLNQEHK